MKLEINVDETMFKDVIENELKAFSKDELHEIIRECIVEYLHNDNILKKIFITTKNNSWSYSTEEPSEVLIQAAKSIDLSPAYKEIQDKMITTLKENHRELLERVMFSMIKEGLTNEWSFRERLASDVEEIIRRRNCN
jgi:hypothetical protein